MKQIVFLIALMLLTTLALNAATGCDLNDPDRDVKRLFPSSSSYKTYYKSLQRLGGRSLLTTIERRLGDRFNGIYETIDNPYTVYEVYSGSTRIGFIHGVNQKGRYGGMQIFLALNNDFSIKQVYFQRFSSRNAASYKAISFTRKFIGLTVRDFDNWNVSTATGTGRIAGIASPAEGDPDFPAVMRGIKKNLILMQHFGL